MSKKSLHFAQLTWLIFVEKDTLQKSMYTSTWYLIFGHSIILELRFLTQKSDSIMYDILIDGIPVRYSRILIWAQCYRYFTNMLMRKVSYGAPTPCLFNGGWSSTWIRIDLVIAVWGQKIRLWQMKIQNNYVEKTIVWYNIATGIFCFSLFWETPPV